MSRTLPTSSSDSAGAAGCECRLAHSVAVAPSLLETELEKLLACDGKVGKELVLGLGVDLHPLLEARIVEEHHVGG